MIGHELRSADNRIATLKAPDFVIRAADPADLPDFIDLASLAGAGFTSLPADEAHLAERLNRTSAAFAGGPGALILALEDVQAGRVVGCAAIKAGHGLRTDFLNFRIADDRTLLSLTPLYADLTEVGSLLVHPDYRHYGVGRWLAMSRYLVIASDLDRFGRYVFSELRGVIDENNRSPFYNGVLGPYLDLTYQEVDDLTTHGRQAELNAMLPAAPIRIDRIGDEARAAMAMPHPEGKNALRFLREEGFCFEGAVDLLDGGPIVVVASRSIRTVRTSVTARTMPGDIDDDGQTVILAAGDGAGFRSCKSNVVLNKDTVVCGPDVLERMRIKPGGPVRFCPIGAPKTIQAFTRGEPVLCSDPLS